MNKYFLMALFLGVLWIQSEEGNPIGKSFTTSVLYQGDDDLKKIGFRLKPAHGEYRYQTYLPKAYEVRTEDKFPILFVMSPGGNVNIGSLSAILEKLEMIGIGLQEAKNGPWEPIIANFLAAHDDVMSKLRVDEVRKFATGFSGGARGSSLFTQSRPGFAGLVLQGAGYWFDKETNVPYAYDKTPKGLRVYMLVGKEDRNLSEIDTAKKGIGRRGKFKSEIIEGGHSPAPQEKLLEALQWVMLQENITEEESPTEEATQKSVP